MAKPDIWMPLYIADYLADTMRLTTEQHGAYLLLIMDYWRNGALPDDDASLASITKLSIPAWRKYRSTFEKMFKVSGGEWRHKRIDEELQQAKENSNKYELRARRAANKRWGKEEQSSPSSNATSTSQASLDDCTSHTPSPAPENLKPEIKHTQSKTPTPEPEPETVCVTSPAKQSSPTNAGLCCKAIRSQGISMTNPHNPIFLELIKAGATEAEFAHAARDAVAKGHPDFRYAIGIVQRQREQAAKLVLHHGRMPNKQEALEASNRAATEGWVPPELREVNRVYK